jgi:hypothetical protein
MDQLEETGIVGSVKNTTREVLIKGNVALNNLLKGLGLNPSDSIYDNIINQQEIPHNELKSSSFSGEDNSIYKKSKFTFSNIVIVILVTVGFFYMISDTGFGNELASFMQMDRDEYQSFISLLVLNES